MRDIKDLENSGNMQSDKTALLLSKQSNLTDSVWDIEYPFLMIEKSQISTFLYES